MTYDKPMVAILLGAISTLTYELFTRIAILFDYGKYSLYELDSLMVTANRPVTIIGLVVGCVIGGTVAVLFYFALKTLGTDYLIFKAIAGGLLTWAVLEAVFIIAIEGKFIPARSVNDYYVHIIGAIIYGFTLGLLFKKFLLRVNDISET